MTMVATLCNSSDDSHRDERRQTGTGGTALIPDILQEKDLLDLKGGERAKIMQALNHDDYDLLYLDQDVKIISIHCDDKKREKITFKIKFIDEMRDKITFFNVDEGVESDGTNIYLADESKIEMLTVRLQRIHSPREYPREKMKSERKLKPIPEAEPDEPLQWDTSTSLSGILPEKYLQDGTWSISGNTDKLMGVLKDYKLGLEFQDGVHELEIISILYEGDDKLTFRIYDYVNGIKCGQQTDVEGTELIKVLPDKHDICEIQTDLQRILLSPDAAFSEKAREPQAERYKEAREERKKANCCTIL